ncbi:2'-5' RNA ligase family protein [Flaviaesturariibacter flavus]|uniref:2'-5' RNA ligase family protein n=1 Tax=Flaviaesturariibacter flavus TaxID=2502780 RepID=A0A4R1BC52_9BACT|nr:2'-5' RNA ligase family protein [Flaviaesturariibacter flavus]TCJ14574.1 2'-5' RNA ligase family protein [Flaviaesturariibacter flavus]
MHIYYAALVLPPELDARILPMKQWMREQHGCKVGLKSPAHITLLPPFWMNPSLEEDLRTDMNSFAATQPSLEICTSGFSAFRPRTLFIDVVADEALKALKSSCDNWFRPRDQYGIKIESRPFHPHITIATRDLHKAAFAAAWAHFGQQSFHECWTATDISILKHNGQGWDVWHRVAFGSVDARR